MGLKVHRLKWQQPTTIYILYYHDTSRNFLKIYITFHTTELTSVFLLTSKNWNRRSNYLKKEIVLSNTKDVLLHFL